MRAREMPEAVASDLIVPPRAAFADVMSITIRFSKWPIFSGFFTMVSIPCPRLATCLALLACTCLIFETYSYCLNFETTKYQVRRCKP